MGLLPPLPILGGNCISSSSHSSLSASLLLLPEGNVPLLAHPGSLLWGEVLFYLWDVKCSPFPDALAPQISPRIFS